MVRNYLKIALRNLKKNKSYLLINTFGMGIALTCCMSAYLLVAYNFEFDNHLKKGSVKNIVKVLQHSESTDGNHYQDMVVPAVMPSIATEEIGGLERYMRYVSEGAYVTYMGEETFSENIHFADSTIFDLFSLGLVSGSYESFKDEKSIYLSEKLANKYFANEDPIGKLLVVEFGNKRHEVFVAGVLERMPLNSTFIPNALMRIEPFLATYGIKPDNWGEKRQVSALFELSDINQRSHIQALMDKYVTLRNETTEDTKITSFELLKFDDPISADEANHSYLHNRIPGIALIIFMTLGFIILLIACFNLTNTTMVLTGKRLKEIGLRKVVGSTRGQIILQFFMEIIITIALAVFVGWSMAHVVVAEFAAMWGLLYGLSDLNGINLLVVLILLLFLSALLTGVYPALFSSKFRPILLLNGSLKIAGSNPLTRTLLVSQFALSVIVLIAGIVFTQNAAFQNKIDFGYDMTDLLTVAIEGEQDFNRLRNAIESHPEIKYISGANNHFGPYTSYQKTFQIDTSQFITQVHEIGYNYLQTVGLEIIDGRNFRETMRSDYESAVIINANFRDRYKLSDPIDTRILHQEKVYRVIGVVENHLGGLKSYTSQDFLYQLATPDQYRQLVVRATPNSLPETHDYIEKLWKDIFPGRPFQSDFQEDIVFQEANRYNRNLTRIFLFLTIMGCLLSVSGIYSLTSLNVRKRTKEIGVRKVLGASEFQIVNLVNKEFIVILGVAGLIGGAGGFFLTGWLLNNLYVQHIQVNIFIVILCALVVFSVGIFTTSSIIFKASRINPIKTLRIE